MLKNKVLARKWKFFVESETVDTFDQISGIESFNIARDKEDLDTTDFDNDGYDSHVVISRSVELEIEGGMKADKMGVRCVGQARVEMIGEGLLEESIARFRIEDPFGQKFELLGSVKLGDVGGGIKDKTSWGFTLVGCGPLTKVVKPAQYNMSAISEADIAEAEEEAEEA